MDDTVQELNDSLSGNNNHSVVYVILDECHYITQDAAFNSGTYKWKELLDYYYYSNKCVQILITATPDEVIPFLSIPFSGISLKGEYVKNELNSKNFDEKIKIINDVFFDKVLKIFKDSLSTWNQNTYNTIVENTIVYPSLVDGKFAMPDYSYVIPYVYENDDELIDIIASAGNNNKSSEEKWLVFVDRIE